MAGCAHMVSMWWWRRKGGGVQERPATDAKLQNGPMCAKLATFTSIVNVVSTSY